MSRNRILIADDEADIALILKLQLEDTGYATTRVRDGVEVLEMLDRESFELLLLDIKMPRLDGLQVLSRVKESCPGMAVVMMTAHGSEDIAVEAMKKGAADYITKPFSSDDMLKRVDRAIRFNRTLRENERLQQELQAEQKKTEAILQGMAELLIAVDTDGRIISANRMAEQLLGRQRQEFMGRGVEEVLQATFPGGGMLPCRQVLQSGQACLDVTYQLAVPTGSIPVLASASPLYGSAGELNGAVEIIRDISSLKALEQEKEDFVSMLSHDLKNPITSIVGSLDLVREGRLGPINDDQRQFIEAAEESCSEMVEMINSLLDIHKFEAGKMSMHYREERPQHLLDKIGSQYALAADRAGVLLQFQVPPDLPECRLDRTTFIRLVGNLLSNALKFTPEKGRVTVTADVAPESGPLPAELYPAELTPVVGPFLRIQVRDTGAGIPRDSLTAIFDRFVQGQNRRMGKGKGTGLGLAFCRKVTDAHRGYIWAESEEGRGSLFTALFPLAVGTGEDLHG